MAQDKIKSLDEEIADYKSEISILRMKDTTYRNMLENHGYGYVKKAIQFYEEYQAQRRKKFNGKRYNINEQTEQ